MPTRFFDVDGTFRFESRRDDYRDGYPSSEGAVEEFEVGLLDEDDDIGVDFVAMSDNELEAFIEQQMNG